MPLPLSTVTSGDPEESQDTHPTQQGQDTLAECQGDHVGSEYEAFLPLHPRQVASVRNQTRRASEWPWPLNFSHVAITRCCPSLPQTGSEPAKIQKPEKSLVTPSKSVTPDTLTRMGQVRESSGEDFAATRLKMLRRATKNTLNSKCSF